MRSILGMVWGGIILVGVVALSPVIIIAFTVAWLVDMVVCVRNEGIRIAWWKVTASTSCPFCHHTLKASGWEPFQRFSCLTPGCRFNGS